MKQYVISFFKKKNDSLTSSVYYREFQTFNDLIEWCNDVKKECGFYKYSHKTISLKKYLEKTK